MSKLQDNIDVVIPVFNGAAYVADAIESVMKQQPLPKTIIVIDDCSTDYTPSILKRYETKIEVIRHDINCGLPTARKTGIEAGNSELIAFLDADDAWTEGKIEKQIKAFKDNPQIGLCYTDIVDCDSRLNPVRASRGFRQRGGEYVFNELYLEAFPIPPSTVIVRREVFDACGPFDESMLRVEDFECWLRIAMLYPISCIGEPLCLRRNNPNSITNTSILEKEIYYTLRAFDLCAQSASKWNIRLPVELHARKRLYFYRRLCESINWRDPQAEIFFRKKLLESGGMSLSEEMGLTLQKAKDRFKAKVKKLIL